MTARYSDPELALAEQLARGYYLRTGHLLKTQVFLAELERKFNPYHDPDEGRFTFAPGGLKLVGHTAMAAMASGSAPPHKTSLSCSDNSAQSQADRGIAHSSKAGQYSQNHAHISRIG